MKLSLSLIYFTLTNRKAHATSILPKTHATKNFSKNTHLKLTTIISPQNFLFFFITLVGRKGFCITAFVRERRHDALIAKYLGSHPYKY